MKKSLKFCLAIVCVLFGMECVIADGGSSPTSEEGMEAQSIEFREPLIRSDEIIRGTKGAPLLLVEYSDFECPYCARGFQTVKALLKKYKGKIQFVYKHFPLPFHANAMIASRYYEAIRLQDEQKAIQFHDEIFENQQMLKNGESFLQSLAKGLNVDMKKLAKDINSSEVQNRIDQDVKEAIELGFRGTPGFLLNGVPLEGAYPIEYFDAVVQGLVEMGKVTL